MAADATLSSALFERVIAWVTARHGEAVLREARRAFELATGPIVEIAQDYEQRISHFLEQALCADAPAWLSEYAANETLSARERSELAGFQRSHRSLFVFEGFAGESGRLRDSILGGLFRFSPGEHDQKLVPGDRFDGRLVPVACVLYLSPGRVYHPPEAHAALDRLLAQLDRDALAHAELLNALLLMRSRFLQFESVRAEHVYQDKALAPVRLRLRE